MDKTALILQAMALAVPDVAGHPNRMPFSGIMTRIDEASDVPPGGSSGHRTLLPKNVAESALSSLLGMAISFKPEFDGHDHRSKLGVITAANIVGNAIEISGFFYQADFPLECAQVKAAKDKMGFSFECQAHIADTSADIWTIDYCFFTGAAVLYKDLAAYTTTSLTANAENGYKMTPEELKALMEGIAATTTAVTAQSATLATLATRMEKVEAMASLSHATVAKVSPHIDAIQAAADAMEAAGIGADRNSGHVQTLRNVAAHMAAAAVSGKIPTTYQSADYLPTARVEAGAGNSTTEESKVNDAQVKALTDSIAALGTQVADLKAEAFKSATPPVRATLSPEIKKLLAKGGVTDDDVAAGKLTAAKVDEILDAAGIKGTAALEAKLKLRHSGAMKAGTKE